MADQILVEIVTPERVIFRGEATSFRAPGVQGSFEVLANHAPMLAAASVGAIYVTTLDGKKISFATSGGFVEVTENRVIMIAETAEPVNEIDLERAQNAEEKIKLQLESADSTEDKELLREDLERARNRLRLAMGSISK